MGKRSKPSDTPVLTTPQAKAVSFDIQHAASVQRAEAKTEARQYPYDREHLSSKK